MSAALLDLRATPWAMPTSTNLHRGEPTLAPRGRDCSEANPAEVRVCGRTMDARWDESMKSDGQVVRERGCIPRTGWHRLKGWLVPAPRKLGASLLASISPSQRSTSRPPRRRRAGAAAPTVSPRRRCSSRPRQEWLGGMGPATLPTSIGGF
ncbi:hypothetical protein B2J93_4694 [Marssonina coronariae]|uniref:Uncharacterized protein n=1 Tax=Diplocarpon coronariae TaxID=2795749 RepID=A0A218Z2D0_9HELO|nr:hypothetical protein B2J93_4694 [Marssonina coronariae]